MLSIHSTSKIPGTFSPLILTSGIEGICGMAPMSLTAGPWPLATGSCSLEDMALYFVEFM